jgi:hypothetical protein
LFPEVRDSDGLTAARVRGRMIRESNAPQGIAEAFHPFVNEWKVQEEVLGKLFLACSRSIFSNANAGTGLP